MDKNKEQQMLDKWQRKLSDALNDLSVDRAKMDRMEELMDGTRKLRPLTKDDVNPCTHEPMETPHVWNIVHENIESMVDSNIPQPKVMARRKMDEPLAVKIEAMLRNELERLPMEEINDQQERTVPIQGGSMYYVEWDQTIRGPRTMGDVVISALHPKMVVPQPGVYTDIEDMDYVFLQIPQTKGYIWRRYGVNVVNESEEEPDLKSSDPQEKKTVTDMVTQNIVYYRQQDGGIGLFSWVNDTVLENLEDYQARRRRVCAYCGADEERDGIALDDPTMDGTAPDPERASAAKPGKCKYCGSTEWEEVPTDLQDILMPITVEQMARLGINPEDVMGESDMDGQPQYFIRAQIPAYKPDVYPVVLQRNVSAYGKFLGESDAEKIQDQQNTLNRMSAKIINQLITAGPIITLPKNTQISTSTKENRVVRVEDMAQKQIIGVEDLTGNIDGPMAYLSQVYEEARRILGITDSFQGRKDTTATSGTAKEFAAAQSAGRLESKRIMKNAAYSRLFEMIFKFKLAYCDEGRDIYRRDEKGEMVYDHFDRRDFLEMDEDGNWRWIDDFIFGTDTSATLAGNRQAMWQEATAHLQAGAFGDTTATETLILYWTKMEELHYPGAAQTKQYLTERLEQQQQAAMMQAQQQMMAQKQAQAQQMPAQEAPGAVRS